MNAKVPFALAASLILLFGCTLPQFGGGQPPTVEPGATPPPVVKNETQAANHTPDGNKSNATNVTLPPVEEDPFAGITPRNVSDRISDGQFRIKEDPASLLKIYVISAGTADAVLVNKGGFYMLIDAGNGTPVVSFLEKLEVPRLDVLVATRDDPGAVDGMQDVLDAYGVGEFWDNNVQSNPNKVALVQTSSVYAQVLQKVKAKGMTVKHPEAGQEMEVNGLKVTVLNPQQQRLYSNPDTDAIVLKLELANFCAVLLNPTVQERETAIIGTGIDLRCEVATYFKHGEGRPDPSLAIESYILPKDVIISVGSGSSNLPAPTTLSRLALKKIHVWRTDTNGSIVVSTDGLESYQIGRAK